VDDEEMTEGDTDAGGILEMKLPHKVQIGVRIHEAGAATQKAPRFVSSYSTGGASGPR
jgi:hypothetical protein